MFSFTSLHSSNYLPGLNIQDCSALSIFLLAQIKKKKKKKNDFLFWSNKCISSNKAPRTWSTNGKNGASQALAFPLLHVSSSSASSDQLRSLPVLTWAKRCTLDLTGGVCNDPPCPRITCTFVSFPISLTNQETERTSPLLLSDHDIVQVQRSSKKNCMFMSHAFGEQEDERIPAHVRVKPQVIKFNALSAESCVAWLLYWWTQPLITDPTQNTVNRTQKKHLKYLRTQL